MSLPTDIIDILKRNQYLFHPVVPFTSGTDKLLPLDLTAANTSLTDEILSDVKLFSDHINEQLQRAGALYGIGGYAEHRTVYRVSKVFDGNAMGEEPRRLHLGIDVWGKPHTRIISPLDGLVHSFANNDQPGDYGGTIILTHLLEGITFYTLYGHLSLNSIKNIREGMRIEKGEVFAELGIPAENGHWPPHLHFQIILDLNNMKGDYPGVCKFSEKEKYLANCPDPDLLLQLNQFL
jgi:peptidoglycan LD-endopeptidase LytH